MRAHYFQHVSFEGLGSIEPWLKSAGYEITGTRFFEPWKFPNINKIDLLVVMGGPMSANDEKTFEWLRVEKQFIHDIIRLEKAVLGICLGAQLIASAMGARIYQNPTKEIGWFPVQSVSLVENSTFRFPALTEVFHWHGETFDLPAGATRIAKSEGCENQAFQIGRSVIGLPFHLETTPNSVQDIIKHCGAGLIPSLYVQSESDILAASPNKYRKINSLMGKVLSYLVNTNG
jgi:GMP synthase-like glutamine amidotransferase